MKKILVVRLRFLGDVLLSTPAVRALKQAFPEASLVYVVEPESSHALKGNPHVNEIVMWPRQSSWLARAGVVAAIRRAKFDVAIDWFGNPSSAMIVGCSGARTRIGFDHRGRRWAYTQCVKGGAGVRTAIQVYLQTLEPLGIHAESSNPEFWISPEAERRAAEILSTGCGDMAASSFVLAVFPGASWPAKRWLKDRFAELIRRVLHDFPAGRVVVIEGPREEGLAQAIVEEVGSKDGVFIAASLPFEVVAGILRHSRAVVTNDAAPMHLAAAVGTPAVALFGPGDPSVWFPYGGRSTAIHKPVPCCRKDVCERGHECMKAITVEDVMRALTPLLHG